MAERGSRRRDRRRRVARGEGARRRRAVLECGRARPTVRRRCAWGECDVIDHLAPREVSEIEAARAAGEEWPRVIASFASGTRLLLGWDRARAESGIGGRAACERAARWCAEHGLHLLSFEGEGPGGEPVGERRWFMAVG